MDAPFATLAILPEHVGHVDVRREGASAFGPAKDGQRLDVGDTVRTDDVGRAEVQYSDNAFTRLDVNTTFTLTKLTEEQGDRQVEGTLESGRTWNRAEALTESGSFEQTAGGATAAVAGTAFVVECATRDQCSFIAVFHSIVLKGAGNERQTLDELDQCGTTSGDLCDALSKLSLDEAVGNEWIQANLFLDLVLRGYGPGPFVLVGGVQVFVADIPPASPLAVAVLGASVVAPPPFQGDDTPPPDEPPPVVEPPPAEPPPEEEPPPPPSPPSDPPCNGHGRGPVLKPEAPGPNGRPNLHLCD